MLAVPLYLAGRHVDCERRIRVDRVVLSFFFSWLQAAHFCNPRIRLAGPIEHHVLFRIIAARNPGRGSKPGFERQSIPAIETRIARLSDRVHSPLLLAGLEVVSRDEATARLGVTATGHALDK